MGGRRDGIASAGDRAIGTAEHSGGSFRCRVRSVVCAVCAVQRPFGALGLGSVASPVGNGAVCAAAIAGVLVGGGSVSATPAATLRSGAVRAVGRSDGKQRHAPRRTQNPQSRADASLKCRLVT